jgi:hypothetical protein
LYVEGDGGRTGPFFFHSSSREKIFRVFKFFPEILKVTHLRGKISAHIDGGLSGGSRMPRPGSEDPISVSGIFLVFLTDITISKSRTL